MSTTMENLNVKIESEEKRQFAAVAHSLGTTPSNAVRMFVRAFNEFQGFPFDVSRPYRMSAEAEQSYDELNCEIEAGTAHSYTNVDELRKALEL